MSLLDTSARWFPVSARVSALRARGLRIKGKDGTNDAYVALQAGRESFRTPVAEKLADPVWGEKAGAFIFTVPPDGAALQVRVLHRVQLGADKVLGLSVIDLHELREQGGENPRWFKLLNKAGKADKERGEVQLDVQFLKNSMSVSMTDLSDRSHSRLGKFKDKLRGKKRDGLSDSASAVLPAISQVLTDSEGEGEAKGESPKKKKNKLKSLLGSKSSLQRNMSRSMTSLGTLPDKNSSVSSSTSSGLNVEPSEAKVKKKFKFLTHKRNGSADSTASNQSNFYLGASNQNAASQVGLQPNQEDPEPQEIEEEEEDEEEERWRQEEEERRMKSEELHRRMEEEEKEKVRRTAEEERMRIDRMRMEREEEEQIKKQEEDRKRKEEERRRMEEDAERKRRKITEEEERMKTEREEQNRMEERKRRAEEEERMKMEAEEGKRVAEEERKRKEEERRLEEKARMKMEQDERRRIEEDEMRMEKEREEQRRKMEEEETERKRQTAEEEEEKERMRTERKEEEQRRKLEEGEKERKRKIAEVEEKEKERMRMERKEEEQRRKLEEEEKERKRKIAEEEEKEKERMRTERKEEEQRRKLEEEEKERKWRVAEEELERQRLEKKEKEEEEKRAEQERKRREEEERMKMEEERWNVELRKMMKQEGRRDEHDVNPFEGNAVPEEFSRSARISNVKPSASVSHQSLVNANPFLDDCDLENLSIAETMTKKGRAPLPPQTKPQERDSYLRVRSGIEETKHSKHLAPQPPEEPRISLKVTSNQQQVDINPFTCDQPTAKTHKEPPSSRGGLIVPEDGPSRLSSFHQEEEASSNIFLLNLNRDDTTAVDTKTISDQIKVSPDLTHQRDLTDLSRRKEPLENAVRPHPVMQDCSTEEPPTRSQKKSQAPPPPLSNLKGSGDRKSPNQHPLHPTSKLGQSQEIQRNLKAPAPDRPPSSSSSFSPFTLHGEEPQLKEPCALVKVDEGSGPGFRTLQVDAVPRDGADVKARVTPASGIRQRAVKPLNSADPEAPEPRRAETAELKPKAPEAVLNSPYSQLTEAELISMALQQQQQISERDARILELERYVDDLVLRVMEEKPSILMNIQTNNHKT